MLYLADVCSNLEVAGWGFPLRGTNAGRPVALKQEKGVSSKLSTNKYKYFGLEFLPALQAANCPL
jgi:hypothetical protein